MAKVKCEYCGCYLSDSDDRCPSCGAPNKNMQRTAQGTPRTINELKSWYKARNLPPENVTRFFIGKDIKEPRAFGIFEKDGVYTVYKNKSDGTRAVRYSGTDEAYAVNELYLRLKEEILNQKSNNLSRQYSQQSKGIGKGKRKIVIVTAVIALMVVIVFPIVLAVNILVGTDGFMFGHDTDEYYLSDNKDIYYMVSNLGDSGFRYEWWEFDRGDNEWSLYATYDDRKQTPPELEDGYKTYTFATDLVRDTGISYENLAIYNSKTFIDAGHHTNPSTAYYKVGDNLYYFLDDTNSYYGDTDNTGWYIYKNGSWQYYCNEDNKDAIGDELWYYDYKYEIGRTIDSVSTSDGNTSSDWNINCFEDTSWYSSYESNNRAYEEHQKEYESTHDDYDDDWSSDSSYDWDSGSSWDSGSTDWDSDW